MAMKPSVGRIVHFVKPSPSHYDDSLNCLPAIVTAVNGDQTFEECSLTVFGLSGSSVRSARHDEDAKEAGTWHWPEVV